MMQEIEDTCVRSGQIDIDKPRYDQSTYIGRAYHFFVITNPLNLLVTNRRLDECAKIVKEYRSQQLKTCLSVDELWTAKQIYDSAFHPETGEKMNIIGRMSAQVPMNTLIVGGMMVFYKGTYNPIFWQWVNQSFNALVNYTNRSGTTKISNTQLWGSYLGATIGAVSAALTLNHLAKAFPPVVARLVPFGAVAVGNFINIPIMRSVELKNGLLLADEHDMPYGYSKIAARRAILAVIFSRIFMAVPGMALSPFALNALEKKGHLAKNKWLGPATQVILVALCLTFATPMCCALFKQKAEIKSSSVETDIQEKLKSFQQPPNVLFYNKGL